LDAEVLVVEGEGEVGLCAEPEVVLEPSSGEVYAGGGDELDALGFFALGGEEDEVGVVVAGVRGADGEVLGGGPELEEGEGGAGGEAEVEVGRGVPLEAEDGLSA
jgi:hypothetical protein